MTVAPSTIITEGSATSPDDLWPLAYLLRPDWGPGVGVRTSYTTDVAKSKSVAEQRRGLLGKPFRLCDANLRSWSSRQTLMLQTMALRAAEGRQLAPLYSDQMTLTAAASSTTLTCDTTYRRLFNAARVVIYDDRTELFEIATIASFTSTAITLTGSVSRTYPIGATVWPLIEARLDLSFQGQITTDRVIDAHVEAIELPGPAALDASAALASTPAGYSTYGGYPILALQPNMASPNRFSIIREGNYSSSGLSQVATTYGARAAFNRTIPFTLSSRADFWKILTLFDSRGGRLFPFWVASPSADFDVVSWDGSGVSVKAYGPVQDWSFRKYLSIVKTDGTVQIRTIVSVVRTGSTDAVTLDSAFTSPTTNLVRLGMGYLMRCASDEMTELWHTNTVCEIDLAVEELINEKSISIDNLLDPITAPLPGPWTPIPICIASEVVVPMFYWPCPAPSERPLGRAATLTLPQDIVIGIGADITRDSTFPLTSGSVSDETLAALHGDYKCEFVGWLAAVGSPVLSRHWHHAYVYYDGSWHFGHNGTGGTPFAAKAVWRATKDYAVGADTHTITVEVIAEWDVEPASTPYGMAGLLLNVYVYGDEINTAYVEGAAVTVRNGAGFTKTDPAVWGYLYPPGATTVTHHTKWCHPKMLLCGSVPTSWTAPCGNAGGMCNDTDLRDGLKVCDTPLANDAPWVGNLPSGCPKNVVFGPEGGSLFRAVTLGGDCPESMIFPLVIVENKLGDGVTALKPGRSGWNETTGAIDILGGSTLTISACQPAQSDISCCDQVSGFAASPKCFGAPTGAPEACCFPIDSTIQLKVTQKCLATTIAAAEDCSAIDLGCQPKIEKSQTDTHILSVCNASYAEGADQANRVIEWDAWVFDKSYDRYSKTDDFDAVDPLTWTVIQGTWSSFTGGTAKCTAAGTSIFPANVSTGPSILNFTASVEVLRAVPQGIAQINSGGNGYVAIADSTAKTLKLYRIDSAGTVLTLLAQATGLTLTAPYILNIGRVGGNWTASIQSNAQIHATDCTYLTPGIVSLIGTGASTPWEFDNFSISDNNGFVRLRVWFDNAGWHARVPEVAMPLYPAADNCPPTSGDPLVGTEGHCPATYTTRTLFPTSISVDQPSVFIGRAGIKPYSGLGGTSDGCVGCADGCTFPFADFEGVQAIVIPHDDNCNTDYSESICSGFGAWYSQTIV